MRDFMKELKNCLDETGSFNSFIKMILVKNFKLLRIWRKILNCFGVIKQAKSVFWEIEKYLFFKNNIYSIQF